jgi:hypothetical protein
MKQTFTRFTAILILLSCMAGAKIYAQETSGGLTGKIVDAKGQTIPGATVSAIHLPSGTPYNTSSGNDGRYNIPNMRIGGPYTIKVSFVGMTPQTKDNINVTLGALATLNFVLQDNSTQLAVVNVTASAGTKANTYGTGTNISGAQLKRLPAISRSLQDFTRLTPQVNKDNSFGGTNFRYNNVTIDGAINNDAIGFSPALGGQTGSSGQPGSSTRTNPVSIDAIQDIQVYLAPYDVKIGNFTGGSVNAVTRSGTNEVTGSIYAFGRNASLVGPDNAGGTGDKEPSSFYDYQTGIRVGLPIIKNKLFFFTNEEITRRQDPVLLTASSPSEQGVITQADADAITNFMKTKYGIDPGSSGAYNIYARSNKFFNRLDWNINDKNQLSIRNNTITSQATNLERDQQNFRFGSIDYETVNNQTSTVAELKSRISNSLSNSLVAGYTDIHDFRNPLSSTSLPQMQIAGESPGSTIYIGTDREASIFNMRQKTFEFTDNLTWFKGKHTFTVGTHNELYNITYDFVNSWNGRVDYGATNPTGSAAISGIANFLASQPTRVRGSYNYTNDSRDDIYNNNPSARFNVNLYSLYFQDEIQVSDKFKITPGIRFDLADVPNKQPLSPRTTATPADPTYGTTFTLTQLGAIQNQYLGNVQFSPRVGFNYDANGDKSVVIRGGSGLFTGRIPFAWMGYAFYNNGTTYGFFDKKYAYKTPTDRPATGSDPINNGSSGIGDFIKQQPDPNNPGQNINISNPNSQTQVDVIDNHFKMPQVWRNSLAFDIVTPNKYKFTFEGIYTKTITDLLFQQPNLVDAESYYAYDTQHQQPIFTGKALNSNLVASYILSNTSQGYRYNLTAQVSKSYDFGLDAMVAYTYGQSKDMINGIRNSMESNWQLNQALNPNDPQLATSNYEIKHRIVSNLNYRFNWNKANTTNISLYLSAQSGSPFSYGFVNATIDGTGQQVSLAYIPNTGETANFFQDIPGGATAVQQAQAFDNFINSNDYLNSRRGKFTERNGAFTPWNTQADLRISHDFTFGPKKKQVITLTYDIINLTNLLNKDWGKLYYVTAAFNSTSSVGLASTGKTSAANYPIYTWSSPAAPYLTDNFASRYQMQLGVRYSF